MQKCPNCGYKVYSLWPLFLMQLAFGVLYFSLKYKQGRHDWLLDGALVIYLIGSTAFGVVRRARTYDLKTPGIPQSTIDR